MKLTALILTLLLTACGTDNSKTTPAYEANLPATFSEGTILTEGVTLGDKNCSTTWPAVMPYEVDGAGTYHAGDRTFPAVEGKDKTWAYQGKRVNGYLPVTVFTVNDDSITVRLKCSYQKPIEHAL